MKKILLTLTVLSSCFAGFGQTRSVVKPGTPKLSIVDFRSNNYSVSEELTKSNATISLARRANPNQNHTGTVCNVIALGNSTNAFGSSGANRTKLWYDQDLNAVVYTHRALCGTPSTIMNSGYYTYDISTNGGGTWLTDQGPIYGAQMNNSTGCAALGPHRGRYPKGVLYNPAGNTDINNAHIAYAGPWNTDVGAVNSWYGQVYGTGNLSGAPAVEHYDSLDGHLFWPEDMFVTKGGTVWKVGYVADQTTNASFMDSLGIYKGVWNGTDFNYTYYPIHYTTNIEIANSVGIAAPPTDMNIAFSDDGMTGYIVLVTNQDPSNAHYVDSTLYMQVLKTIDGGETWSCPIDLDFTTCLDAALIGQGLDVYASSWDIDIVVDKNNNPHIINTVVPAAGPGSVFLAYAYGTYGIFDFYSTDQGNAWQAQLLAHPQTYCGQWCASPNQLTEFQRPFVSRTWDGSKLYFGWFDTDTATFFVNTNTSPDLRLVGYDVDNNKWTADLSNFAAVNGGENITTLTNADGACILGEGPYYVREGGPTSPSVPVTYGVMSTGCPDGAVQWYYVDCAAPTGTFTFNGNPLPVTTHFYSPLCADGSGVVLSVQDLTSDLLVSSNYPNPFTGKTSVDVTLAKAGDVSVEINNVVGQKLVTSNYQNLHSGKNTITLDGSALSHGLYFFTVKAGNKSVTKTMTVE